jgi:integrase
MNKLINLSKSRHGVYYFRQYFGQVEKKTSLRTKDFALAKARIAQLYLDNHMIKKLEVTTGGFTFKVDNENDLDLMRKILDDKNLSSRQTIVEQSVSTPLSSRLKTKSFIAVAAQYHREREFSNTTKTLLEKQKVYTEFNTLLANDDFNAVTDDAAIAYKNRLIGEGKSVSRINKIISMLKDLFDYGITNKHYFDANPFTNIRIKSSSKSKSVSYEQFTQEELIKIFNEDFYKQKMNKPDYYWVPFLALYTGARIEELASLKFSNIKQENGIWILNIEKGKTTSSIRKIPIHKRIIESKFFDYLESQHNKDGLIFTYLNESKNGYSKNCGRRFAQYLDFPEINIRDERKVFHSFRSTYINNMTNLGCHPAILMSLVGHYEQSKVDFSSPHFQNYQQTKPMEILKEWNDKLEYTVNLWF